MDYINLIGSLGFPIVACICMALFIVKFVLPLKASVDNNTSLIQEFLDYLRGLKK